MIKTELEHVMFINLNELGILLIVKTESKRTDTNLLTNKTQLSLIITNILLKDEFIQKYYMYLSILLFLHPTMLYEYTFMLCKCNND